MTKLESKHYRIKVVTNIRNNGKIKSIAIAVYKAIWRIQHR